MAQQHLFSLSPNNRRSAITVSELINHQSPQPPLSTPEQYSSPCSSTILPISSPRTPHFNTTALIRTSPIRKHNQQTPPSPSPSSHNNTTTRGPWRIEEDRLLIDLVRQYGPRHWSVIATHFRRRSGKQARERWLNQLDPALKKKNWTAEEDTAILRAHASMGNRWSAIARLLPGRTDNSVKNRFNSTLKRAMRERDQAGVTMDIHDIVSSLHARPFYPEQSYTEPKPFPPDFYYRPTNTTMSSATYDSTTSDERDLWVRGTNGNTRMASRFALSSDQQQEQGQQQQQVDTIQCRDTCLPGISQLSTPSIINETANNRAIR